MNKLIIPAILFILLSACSQKERLEYPHYDIELSLLPAEQYISVTGSWKIPLEPGNGTIEFYLHKQLEVKQLLLNGRDINRLSVEESDISYMPDAKKYTIKTGSLRNRTATISFNYDGRITDWNEESSSVIGEEWTEMGSSFPWYPYSTDYNPFSYEVEILTDGNLCTFMMGSETRDDYYAIYRAENPTNDMVVCAAKDLKTISSNQYRCNFKLAHTSFSEEFTDTLVSDIEAILGLFNNWFPPGNNKICLVESMRENGRAYTRLGGIYLPGFDESNYYKLRKHYTWYLAHEIAHLWWYRANSNTWEGWLNESLAEYSALRVLRELYGQQYFNEWIEAKEQKSEGTAPVWQLNCKGGQALTILYDKAPLLLYELEQKAGTHSFELFMWSLLRHKASTTEEFLNILEEKQGKEVKEWFITRLKEA